MGRSPTWQHNRLIYYGGATKLTFKLMVRWKGRKCQFPPVCVTYNGNSATALVIQVPERKPLPGRSLGKPWSSGCEPIISLRLWWMPSLCRLAGVLTNHKFWAWSSSHTGIWDCVRKLNSINGRPVTKENLKRKRHRRKLLVMNRGPLSSYLISPRNNFRFAQPQQRWSQPQ